MQCLIALIDLLLSDTSELRTRREEGSQALGLFRRHMRHLAELGSETVRVSEELSRSAQQSVRRQGRNLHSTNCEEALDESHYCFLNLCSHVGVPKVALEVGPKLKHCMRRQPPQLAFGPGQLAAKLLMLTFQQPKPEDLICYVCDLLMVSCRLGYLFGGRCFWLIVVSGRRALRLDRLCRITSRTLVCRLRSCR